MTKLSMALIIAAIGVTGCGRPRQGVLVMAHGGDAEWNQQVEAAVAPLRATRPTEIAFGMADSSTLRTAVEKLESQGVQEIAVVRLFISGDSFLPETEYILGLRREPPAAVAHMADTGNALHAQHAHHAEHAHPMAKPEPIRSDARFLVSRDGVAESPLVDDVLVARVQALSEQPAQETVLVLAHGPGDDAEDRDWLANMERRVQRIRELGRFREVRCETLREDWPDKRSEAEPRIREFVAQGSQDGGRVLVVPFRIAGFGPYAEVLQGLEYVSDGRGLCPHPNMTRWLEQTAESCLARR